MRKCRTCGGEFDAFFDNSNHECPHCYWDRYRDELGYESKAAFFANEREEYTRAFGQPCLDEAFGN